MDIVILKFLIIWLYFNWAIIEQVPIESIFDDNLIGSIQLSKKKNNFNKMYNLLILWRFFFNFNDFLHNFVFFWFWNIIKIKVNHRCFCKFGHKLH